MNLEKFDHISASTYILNAIGVVNNYEFLWLANANHQSDPQNSSIGNTWILQRNNNWCLGSKLMFTVPDRTAYCACQWQGWKWGIRVLVTLDPRKYNSLPPTLKNNSFRKSKEGVKEVFSWPMYMHHDN